MKLAVPNPSAAEPIKVMVVDDHPLMRVGVAAIIDARPEMQVIAQAGTGEEAVALHALHRPDVTLMDLRLPGISGVEALRRIRWKQPTARCIVLTTYEGDEDIHQAFEAGAAGYLIKGMPQETLILALTRVHRGERFLPLPVAKALHSRTPDSALSAREREVLELLVKGQSNRDIAHVLRISESTVKTHVSVILMRLGVSDRTQAVVVALRRGIAHL